MTIEIPITPEPGEGASTTPSVTEPVKRRGGRRAKPLGTPSTGPDISEPAAELNSDVLAAIASLGQAPVANGEPPGGRRRGGGKRNRAPETTPAAPPAQPDTTPAELSVEIDDELRALAASLGKKPAAQPAETAPEAAEELTVEASAAAEAPAGTPEAPTEGRGGGLWDFLVRKLDDRFKRRPTPPAETSAVTPGGSAEDEESPAEEPAIKPEGVTESTETTPVTPPAEVTQPTETFNPPPPLEPPPVVTHERTPAEASPVQPAPEAAITQPTVHEIETPETSRRERIIEGITHKLGNTLVFGRPLPEMAFSGIGLGGVRWGARELAKGIVSWSGAAGAVGGGIAGTALAGAFVGALAGAAVEYFRQVNANLSARVSAENPSLTSRKAIFLQKLKETREHREVFTQVNTGKLARAAIFGAITGAGAGAIAEIPGVREFLSEHVRGLIPNLGGVGQTVSEAVKSVGEAAGAGGETVGDVADQTGEAIGETASEVSQPVGEQAGEASPGDTAREEVAAKAPENFVPEANLVALQNQVDTLNNQLADNKAALDALRQTAQPPLTEYVPKADFNNLQRELADVKKALAATRGVTSGVLPSAEQAAAAASSVAEQAAAEATEAVQNQINEAFAALNLDDTYQLHTGDSVAGITEKLGKSLGLTSPQVWELGRRLAEQNGVTSPYYGTVGNVLDRNLPIGKVMNMQGVKGLALEMLKNKVK